MNAETLRVISEQIKNATCMMLVDQGRYIGNDPVGYSCSNLAKFKDLQGNLWCPDCREIFMVQPGRITMPDPKGAER